MGKLLPNIVAGPAIVLACCSWAFCQEVTKKDSTSIEPEKLAEILRAGQQEWAQEMQREMRSIAMMWADGHIGGRRPSNRLPRPPDIYWPSLSLEVGSIGVLHGTWRSFEPSNLDLKIVQVIDGSNLLATLVKGDTMLLLQNVSTEGMTDGKIINYSDPVIVSGTKRYSTVLGGTNTVLVIKPFHVDEEVLQEAKKLAKKPAKKPARKGK